MSDEVKAEPPPPENVLELRDVSFRDEETKHALNRIAFSIQPGRLLVIRYPTAAQKPTLTRGIMGLLQPSQGEVLFRSFDWQKVAYKTKLELRTHIGRVFDIGGWIQNLTLFDNILLGPRHHTHQSESQLFDQMKALAASFQLELENQRPAFVAPWRLKLLQWVRALISDPKLLVVERPLVGVPNQFHDTVFANEMKYRQSGGATLWITDSEHVMKHARKLNADFFQVQNETLVPGATRGK